MGTGIVLIGIAVIVILAIFGIVKRKKAGKSLQCGGDCDRCPQGCGEKGKKESVS